MMATYSFGEWCKLRRQQMRLTRREVARASFCSADMIKKIETDARRPSAELATALAAALEIPAAQQARFVAVARGQKPVDRLAGVTVSGAVPDMAPPPVGRLPQPGTRFVGREAELADVLAQLRAPDCRLLTLLGPGGIGKTRLAIEAGRRLEGAYAAGAAFVPLAAVSDAADIPSAIFQALGVEPAGDVAPLPQLQRLLGRQARLLLLDNFEQLAHGPDVLGQLLSTAPQLTLLVTSRARLNLAEEWVYPLPALAESAELFAETARRHVSGFDAAPQADAIDRICRLVGRHPLAIELAASWTRLMPLNEVAAQISRDLDFLAGGPRNAPDRHRSLRALFDHSWRLLAPDEQQALARLAVFRGGFAPEQARVVAGADWSMLRGLVDKSLVEARGARWFDLHPLTRQYAHEQLARLGLREDAHWAHFEAYADLARQLAHQVVGPQALAALRRAQREHDNIVQALAWGVERRRTDAVLHMINDMFRFWLSSGKWREGAAWATKAVALAEGRDSAPLCLTLNHLGSFLALQGRFHEANPRTQAALAMARRLEEPLPLATSLMLQGQARRDKAGVLAAFEETIEICRQHRGERPFDILLCTATRLHGDRLLGFGMLEEARAKYEESLDRFRALGDVLEIAYPLGNLGRLALHEGDLARAHALIEESVAIARSGGNLVSIADWVFRLGQVHLFQGYLDAAEGNLRETLRLYDDIGNRFGPPGVLSNLALVALERGDLARAETLIGDSFRRYGLLNESTRQVDRTSDFLEFGDSIDSLLHAGLVATARRDWLKATRFFEYFAANTRGYAAIRPLREKVATARAAIGAHLSGEAHARVAAEARQMDLATLFRAW